MTIEELHDHLFDVLCVVDDICKKENVRYFLDSGTEIGAVREGDYIAWDDDMDIKVMAEDYPAFKEAMRANLPPYMRLVEPIDLAPAFYDFVVRIIDERYRIRELNEEEEYYGNLLNCVGTDVFIFSKASDCGLRRKASILYNKYLYGLGMAHRYKNDNKKYSIIQKAEVTVLTFVGRYFSVETIIRWKEKDIFRHNNKTTKYRLASTYTLKHLEHFTEDCYTETTYFPIRDRQFPVPIGYDKELKQIYRNYMKPEKDAEKYNHHLK